MYRPSDSEDDEPTPEPNYQYTTSSSNADLPQQSQLTDSDSSDDDERSKACPVKRKRTSTGASSQSSSSSASDHHSQPDSDPDAPPSFGNYQQFNLPQADTSEPPKVLLHGIGEKIMRGKGYVEGKGLGKYGQGRVEPIQASTQRGRVGFGFQSFSKGRKYTGPKFNAQMENISAQETPVWMEESPDEQLDRDLLESWMVMGPKKMTIDDEVWFCEPEILQDILSLKTGLDAMKPEELRRVRAACNPFEKIGNVFFINRAALKMANLDSCFDFMFTDPKDEHNKPLVSSKDLLYFADVCAGPGGFTEYVLWRKKWNAKGFGFTLKASNDFKLSELHAVSTETFTPFYGTNEDGDIYNPQNLESLKKFVLANTNDKGVHFLMADGGFSVEGQENIQEILSKQLYTCQCIAALSVVRDGGNFLVKLFDVFTEFSVGLIYLMYRSFDKICLHKPNTSRPANSERYLICKGKRASSDTIERHLFYVNSLLYTCSQKKGEDVRSLVPLEVIRKDEKFFNYIMDSNNRIGTQQKVSLLKLIDYHANPKSIEENRHSEMRTACLKIWKIPDQVRMVSHPSNHKNSLKTIIDLMQSGSRKDFDAESFMQDLLFRPKIVRRREDLLDTNSKKSVIQSLYDWKFVFLNNFTNETTDNKFSFYMGSTGSIVFQLEGKYWRPTHDFRLPAGTLILAEKVNENFREGRGMRRTAGLHIVDAYCLGGECVFHKPLQERYDKIELFCRAHSKPLLVNSEKIPMRCKKLFRLENLAAEVDKLVKRQLKKMDMANTTPVPNLFDNSDLYYVTKSVLLMKDVKTPWTKAYSRTQKKIYYFNSSDNNSSYEFVTDSILDAISGLKHHLEWQNVETECRDDPMIRYLTNQPC